MSDKDRSLILRTPELQSLLTEGTALLRRPVHWPRHLSCRVPDWSRAWVDRGGSLWGPGPYLKVWNMHRDDLARGVDDDWATENRVFCPWGYPGEGRLWVKETWGTRAAHLARDGFNGGLIVYRADGEREGVRWRASTCLRREDARLWVVVVSVDVERAAEGWEWLVTVRRTEGAAA